MKKNIQPLLWLMAVLVTWSACKKSNDTVTNNPVPTDTTSNPISSPAKENFESGTKDSYDPSSISLSTGKWHFNNAVIGTTGDDRRNDNKSARIQGKGSISMNFDIVGGVYRVAIISGVFGTDGPSTWQLWVSYNSGSSYSQIGNDITTTGTVLQHDTIVINAVNKVRFAIRKSSVDNNRLNIDDVSAILTSGPLAPNFADDNHMLLGNPTNATPSPLDEENYYMDKGYYALCYQRSLGIPKWVSWHLSTADIGSTPRQDDFRPDDDLPVSWYHVSDQSYAGSGFDRGHQCPSNDRTLTVPANSSTFLMTNMIPQAPNLNQGAWQKLEDSCNRLVTLLGKEVYIICGSYGTGGTGNNGLLNSIDNERISVPARLWKIVVVLPNGNNDLSRITTGTRVIAVDMPNDNTVGIGTDWKSYRVSVDALETIMGYDFLSNVPAAVQQVIEAQVDNL